MAESFNQSGYSQSASLLAHNLIATSCHFIQQEYELLLKQKSSHTPFKKWGWDFFDKVKKFGNSSEPGGFAVKYAIRLHS